MEGGVAVHGAPDAGAFVLLIFAFCAFAILASVKEGGYLGDYAFTAETAFLAQAIAFGGVDVGGVVGTRGVDVVFGLLDELADGFVAVGWHEGYLDDEDEDGNDEVDEEEFAGVEFAVCGFGE